MSATVDSLVNKIKGLLTRANNTTSQSDTDLTSAVDHLIDGYGGGGTDVSDTTATASDVMSGKDFYNSDGIKTNGTLTIKQVTPSNTPAWESGYVEIMNGGYGKGGYIIPTWGETTPSSYGTAFSAGFRKMTYAGYAYSEKPKTLKAVYVEGHYTTTGNYTIEQNDEFLSINKSVTNANPAYQEFTVTKEITVELDMFYYGTNITTTVTLNGTTIATLNASTRRLKVTKTLAVGDLLKFSRNAHYGGGFTCLFY